MTANSFGSLATLRAGGTEYQIHRLDAVDGSASLPFSLKILLENLLRTEDGRNVTAEHVTALAQWDPPAEPSTEIQFTPARVIMQDLTGVPAVVDLATMREAMRRSGRRRRRRSTRWCPAELVIDHSVVADIFGRPDAFDRNVELEFERNRERFQFLRWGQEAFDQFKVVPPGTGIVHQVNIEHLARVVMRPRRRRLPGHLRRHRLAHHHAERPRRARLGRRRHRGRGGHARPADQHADPAGGRLPADRRAAVRRHRHRPGADHHRAAAQARRGRQVRRVLRRRRGRGAAGQPGHDRQHEPGVRLHLRDLPDRRARRWTTCGSPAARTSRSRSSRRTPRSRACGTTRRAEPHYSEELELDLSTDRAVAGRPEAAAGPGGAGRRQARVPRSAGRLRVRAQPGQRAGRHVPGVRPGGRARTFPRRVRAGPGRAGRRHRRRRWTTARW